MNERVFLIGKFEVLRICFPDLKLMWLFDGTNKTRVHLKRSLRAFAYAAFIFADVVNVQLKIKTLNNPLQKQPPSLQGCSGWDHLKDSKPQKNERK